MKARRELTKEEQAWKSNLVRIWNAKKDALGLNQEKLADRIGWNSQGTVGQYLTGRIPLNTDAKIKFAKALGVDVSEIDPNLKGLADKLPTNAAEFLGAYGEGIKMLSESQQIELAKEILKLATESGR